MELSEKSVKKLFKKANVVGVGSGKMYRDGKYRGEGIIVTVKKKAPSGELRKQDMIPQSMEGKPIDVIEVGEIKLLEFNRKGTHRPFPMSSSIGHIDITCGTAGCLVKKDGITYVLSNNHVLANVNKGNVGDPILQAGPYDGGKIMVNKVGTLAKYIPIDFGNGSCSFSNLVQDTLNTIARIFGSSVRFKYQKESVQVNNTVDCALCALESPSLASPLLAELGEIVSTCTFQVGDIVKKAGRTTDITVGEIISTNYIAQVDMGEQGVAYFDDQYLIGTAGFSAGGDSGSAIVKDLGDGKFALGGLLFAGSGQVTIANKIDNVFNKLGVTL